MNERGAPTPVAWTRLRAPESLMGPADPVAMTATIDTSPLRAKYSESVDRVSAREKLAAKLEAGAAAARAEDTAGASTSTDARIPNPERSKPPARRDQDSMVADIIKSPMARDLARTAAREILRGVFRVGRRR
jgi:hypothetical protein